MQRILKATIGHREPDSQAASPSPQATWINCGTLHLKIALDIGVSGLYAGVSEPAAYDVQFHSRLQQVQSGSVAEGVGVIRTLASVGREIEAATTHVCTMCPSRSASMGIQSN